MYMTPQCDQLSSDVSSMYVCACTYIHISCMHACTCTYIHICMYMTPLRDRLSSDVSSMHVCMYTRACVYVLLHYVTNFHKARILCVCVCVNMHACMYVSCVLYDGALEALAAAFYIHTYMHTHMLTRTRTEGRRRSPLGPGRSLPSTLHT